jgi:hypothetical protein
MAEAKNSTEHGHLDEKADLSNVPLDEEMAGDAAYAHSTRQVLWKMDVRYYSMSLVYIHGDKY